MPSGDGQQFFFPFPRFRLGFIARDILLMLINRSLRFFPYGGRRRSISKQLQFKCVECQLVLGLAYVFGLIKRKCVGGAPWP